MYLFHIIDIHQECVWDWSFLLWGDFYQFLNIFNKYRELFKLISLINRVVVFCIFWVVYQHNLSFWNYYLKVLYHYSVTMSYSDSLQLYGLQVCLGSCPSLFLESLKFMSTELLISSNHFILSPLLSCPESSHQGFFQWVLPCIRPKYLYNFLHNVIYIYIYTYKIFTKFYNITTYFDILIFIIITSVLLLTLVSFLIFISLYYFSISLLWFFCLISHNIWSYVYFTKLCQ